MKAQAARGLLQEQGGVCTLCGHQHALTGHHKIPLAKGGTNKRWNIVGLCRPCHDSLHGIGPMCQACYPDMVAAAIASQMHWAMVLHFTHYGRSTPAFYGRQCLAHKLKIALLEQKFNSPALSRRSSEDRAALS